MVILLCTAFTFAQSPGAQIREMTGTVELKAPGSADWIPAKAGDRIEKATVISTSFKSMATLDLGSSILTVRPLTRLTLNELINQDGTETINVAMATGRIRADVKPPAGSRADFTINTPVATASVRGTVFDIDRANIRVVEGMVLYAPAAGKGKIVRVGAGQKSQIDEDTGNVQNPLKSAETERRIPALAGQSFTGDIDVIKPDESPGVGPEWGMFPGVLVKPNTPIDTTIKVRPISE